MINTYHKVTIARPVEQNLFYRIKHGKYGIQKTHHGQIAHNSCRVV